MYYRGGHLKAQDGDVELGSTDSGALKGFKQLKNGILQISGDSLEVDAQSIIIGRKVSGKFRGISVGDHAVECITEALMVRNPDILPDAKLRMALAQSQNDELMINAKGNYKGGVKFDGAVNMVDLNVQTTLTMKVGSKLLLKTPDKEFPGPLGHNIHVPGLTINVLETITYLQDTINRLQNRIAALEAK